MDYKELIRRLDDCGEFDGDLLDDAAEAIETLLAERDAAVEDLHGDCRFCKHRAMRRPFWRCPCSTCKYEDATTFMPEDTATHVNDNWQWRGPQKGATT